MDVGAWLRGLDMGQYEQAFRDNDIDVDLLPTLTADELRELGVASLGHRKRLLAAIAALVLPAGSQPSAAPSPPAPTPASAGPQAERRQLTVMFVDLVGSTALSARLDPEDLRELIGAYHACVAGTIGRLDGFVAQYLGDGVLAYFGHPRAHEDDAERAIRAGLELVTAVRALEPRPGVALRVRVGIATGLVVVGDLTDGGAVREQAIVGKTPNLAARLQTLAEPDGVVVAADTRRLVGGLFACADLGLVEAKGFPEPVRAYRVLGRGAAESRSETFLTTAVDTPLVGREGELGLLLRRWAQAKGGEGRVVLLSGEPGIGKSRLAAGLAERLADEPHTCLRYFCSPHHQGSPLFPVIHQLERAAGFDRDEVPTARLGKLEALLARTTKDADESALIADLMGLPVGGRRPLPNLTPRRQKDRLLDALLAQLAHLAARRPIMILFEDAHWIDPTSLELLGLAVERIRRLRALLVLTFRPEFTPSWAGLPHVTALALDGLGRREAASLVSQTAGGTALPGEVVDEIVERAGGVPLFLEELTKAVVEADWHEADGRCAPATAPLPTCAVPTTLYAPLVARLDRLGPAAGEVAQIGVAIGREFSHELLAAVARGPEDELRGALDRLVEAGLLFRIREPPRAVFLFKHSLVQDAAYGTLLRARRRELHARIARALEDRFPETAEARPELLAHHFARADMVEEAVGHWGEAGRRAIARSAMAEAAGHLRRALELLPALLDTPARWRRELELQSAFGTALTAIAGYTVPEIGRVYERARGLCEQLGDMSTLIRVANAECIHHLMRAEMDAARAVANDLLRRAEREDGLDARLAAHRLVGTSVLQVGRLRQACQHLEAAAGLLDRAGEGAVRLAGGKDALVGVPTYRAILLLLLGRYDQARAQITLGLAEAERLARPHRLAFALAMTVWFHALLKEDAPHLLTALDRLAAEQRFPYWMGYALIYRGLALARVGETQKGLALVREGAVRHAAAGAAWSVPYSLGMAAELAEGYEGLALVDDALAQVGSTGVRWFEPELQRIRGALLAEAGDAAGAEAHLTEAIRIARGQGAKHWELRAGAGLAQLWHDQGRCEEARDLLGPVYYRFTEGLDTPDLRKAKALLDELGWRRRGTHERRLALR